MIKKSNSKGYMLVEIILAFVVTFAISYFVISLVIKLKNRNDDMMVTTLTSTDQTIISNKLSDLLKEKGKDFDCEKLTINGQTISYEDNVIDVLNDYANYKLPIEKKDWCYVDSEGAYIKINIPIEVKQQDEYYDVNLYQEIGANKEYLNCVDIINSYNCENKKGSEPYAFTYTGECTVIDDGNGNCRVKFTTSGNLTLNYGMQADVFLVGGGGGGGNASYSDLRDRGSSEWWLPGHGGGGGYTKTYKNISIVSSDTYKITIGAGGKASKNGGNTSLVGNDINYKVKGGTGGYFDVGKGGSGGGAGCDGNGSLLAGYEGSGASGGMYGNPGNECFTYTLQGDYDISGGEGQGTTTCEFEQSKLGTKNDLSGCAPGVADYSRGGSGSGSKKGAANTGNGGDGASAEGLYNDEENNFRKGHPGGTGIVIIRNAR